MCNVADVRDIPEVLSFAKDKRSFPFGDAGVDRWNELVISRAEQDRRSYRAGGELLVVCSKD